MATPSQSRTAVGNVPKSVFVKASRGLNTTATLNFYAEVAGVGDEPIGISQEWPRGAPGVTGSEANAAADGQPFMLYGIANERALLIPGAAWDSGVLLQPMAGGLGRPVPANNAEQYFGARSLENATAAMVTNANPVQVETWFGQANIGTSTTTTTTTTTSTTTTTTTTA